MQKVQKQVDFNATARFTIPYCYQLYMYIKHWETKEYETDCTFLNMIFFQSVKIHYVCNIHICTLTRAGEPEPGVFGSFEPEPLEKKTRSRSRLEKSREPEPLQN